MYNIQAKYRLIPEKMASHHPDFALYLVRNTGEVFMKKIEGCVYNNCGKPTVASRSVCWGHSEQIRETIKSDPQNCFIPNCGRNASKQFPLCTYHLTPWHKHLNALQSEQEKPVLLDGVVHICEKHGSLLEHQVIRKHGGAGKEYYRLYLTCRICLHARTREWEKRNPDNVKRTRHKGYIKHAKRERMQGIVRQYKDLTVDEYLEMFRAQNDKCAICGEFETKIATHGELQPLQVDHCHVTGKIRQLLCFKCNAGIGMLRDNPDIMSRAIEYVTHWKLKHSEDENG